MKRCDQLIVALDQMNIEEINSFLSLKDNNIPMVKIGLEVFLKYGTEIITLIAKKYNKKIFLDLKLHDIPITVAKAIAALEGLPIDFLTVHLSGGQEMLRAAIKEAKVSLPNCTLLGVSFLTSLTPLDLESLFESKNSNEAFIRLFDMAKISGIKGVVCSPHEVTLLKYHYPTLFAVTPGIRFADEIQALQTHDQKRVMNPEDAFKAGSDYLVIGRSLTKASNFSARMKDFDKEVL